MARFFHAALGRRALIITLFICAAVICGFLMPAVGQNYDMSVYLPEQSESKIGIDVLSAQFAHNGNALLMLEDASIPAVLAVKQQLESIDGVEQVLWLDDVADVKQPVELISGDITQSYYKNGHALINILFEENDYAEKTHGAIEEIKVVLGSDALLGGSAVDAYNNVNAIGGSILTGILIALGIILLILFLTTDSIFEVILFLFTIGIAVVLNMGTNIIFGEISYMTFSSVAVLQLAVSMDYSIFLLHRFAQEREKESDPAVAMARAQKASFSSIMSSGLTTIVGFLALVFMSYTMGQDMGLVLAKGIILSLICVLLLLPALAVFFVKAIDKTRHRRLLPSLKGIQRRLGGKARYVVLCVLAVFAIIGFLAQGHNTFLYSASSTGDAEQDQINESIEQTFGASNPFVVLVPRGNAVSEAAFAQELAALEGVKNVQGLYAFVDPAIPDEILPESLSSAFLSEDYSRYIAEVGAPIESEQALYAVEQIRELALVHFEGAYVTGASPVIYDIRDATSGDFSMVSLLSILFVGLILLVTFRSLTLPLLLLLVIQTSIWMNMALPYFEGTPMMFIGYMIISAVQLGATIDYAILMTNYYLEGRVNMDKRGAAEHAVDKAGASIMVSALVLSAAGFVVAGTFIQPAMAQLGTMIGRGALLSGFMVIFALPQLLMLLDKVIRKTTLTRSLFTGRKQNENKKMSEKNI